MTSKEIYDLAIKMGIKTDLRGEKAVKKYLDRTKKKYEKLHGEAKKLFDKERLDNPYSDSRFVFDSKKKKEVKKVMVGIDLSEEMIIGKEMGVDLFLNHHPVGRALASLDEVMHLQAEVLADYGVPINIAEQVIKPRISEVGRSVISGNYNRSVDMARMLEIDLMCLHTVCDNQAAKFIKELIEKKKPEYVEELIDVMMEIPEYKEAALDKAGPRVFAGSPDNRCGKIAVTEFTGGTSGSKEMFAKMANAGIGTIIGMHIGEEHRKEAEANHINVVIAGHMSSDSLGLNLFCDELEKKGIEIIPCSSFIRVSRNKTPQSN
ncbi:NGG1p interacting factor NIF3 [Candidatus Falkowbacteria bacterium]|nr:NGG1p interacting factor NIF3 [Candidatus Falkowbacteria bacterium]